MSGDRKNNLNGSIGTHNPHQRLHRVIFVLVSICLTAQVLEGSFFAPYIFVHFGFPQLSLKEVCDEMHSTIYDDPKRFCNFPYPLFEYKPEPWTFENKDKQLGITSPPGPEWKDLGFKDFIIRREERLKRQMDESPGADVNESNGDPD